MKTKNAVKTDAIVEGGLMMNRTQFMNYVNEHFNVSAEFMRLLNNTLYYAELQGLDEDDLYDYLNFMLGDVVGLTNDEIRQIEF